MRRHTAWMTLLWLITMLGLLVACASLGKDENTVLVYYAKNGFDGEVARGVAVSYGKEEQPLTFALTQLTRSPEDSSLRVALPEGARVLSLAMENGLAVVEVSPEWGSMTGYSKTVAEYCLMKTATQFPEITAVRWWIPEGAESGVLREEQFISAPLQAVSAQHELRLYFTDETGQTLWPELRAVVLRESESTEWYQYVVDGLIAGPTDPKLTAVFPQGTRLLSVVLDNRVCIVNLSREFVTEAKGTEAAARTTIMALVHSLTELNGVNSVLVRVENEEVDDYFGLDLSEPLLPSLVG